MVFQEKRALQALQDPLDHRNLAHLDLQAPQDPKACSTLIYPFLNRTQANYWLCVVLGPVGYLGPPGKPGPDCKDPVPGSQGDTGSLGPDGEQGQNLNFRFKKPIYQ